MQRPLTLIALGLGSALALSACDQSDRRTDAGDARNQAEAGQEAARNGAVTAPDARTPAAAGSATGSPQAGGGAGVTLAMTTDGQPHIVDGAGSALYVLAGNTDGSKCDAACQEVWPPVISDQVQPAGATGVDSTLIGTLEHGGRTHVTYGGEPLYRYAGDLGANRTTGAGVEDQWGKWSLVGLDGRALPDPQ